MKAKHGFRHSRRAAEKGAQALEWIGLGGFVTAALGAATIFASSNLGSSVGNTLINHISRLGGAG